MSTEQEIPQDIKDDADRLFSNPSLIGGWLHDAYIQGRLTERAKQTVEPEPQKPKIPLQSQLKTAREWFESMQDKELGAWCLANTMPKKMNMHYPSLYDAFSDAFSWKYTNIGVSRCNNIHDKMISGIIK